MKEGFWTLLEDFLKTEEESTGANVKDKAITAERLAAGERWLIQLGHTSEMDDNITIVCICPM
jgi:hypothetical protein